MPTITPGELVHRGVDTPLGPLLLIASATGVVRLAMPHEEHPQVIAEVAERTGFRVRAAETELDEAAAQLEDYFTGRRTDLDVVVDLSAASGFRRTVLEHLRTIPCGATETYTEVAAATGSPRAVRAVGSACAHNPVPILVPCHRVLRSDGAVGGYLGGTAAKEWLLAHERAHCAPAR